MSDVAYVAAENYSRFTNILYDEAMLVVIGEKDPLPNTEGYLDWCINQAFKEIIGEGR